MSLSPGTRLGPYEIAAPLGAGGMGEVYRARDTRLGRDVAVKVLPPHLSSTQEVRARFEREARAVSSLNHPHICTLHDVGREGAVDYLVMELVEGETLGARLEKGALPTGEVLRLGAQIADALDRAHRAGIVHRDLKPGNVMLTKAGAKLMDFGLARATGMAGAADGSGLANEALSRSPTVSRPLTAEGTIVGTFQYMSPEQLEGGEVDARADIWALGCVLYEMATGKRAFEGKSQASLIGAIMQAEPTPVSAIAAMSPPALDRLVTACLAKDPADRVQSAHDVKLQLEWMAGGAAPGVAAAARPAPARSRRTRVVPIALAASAGAAAAALLVSIVPRRAAAPPRSAERYIVGTADLETGATPMIAPDGASVVFSGRDGTTRRLYRRALASFDVEPIEGTEDGTAPFFSPDGAWIGFVTTSSLKRVPIDGGIAQTIVSESSIASADWAADGTIYFTSRAGGPDGLTALARVPSTGGQPVVVAQLDSTQGESEAWLPEVLPDGKTVLISIVGSREPYWKIVAVVADGSRRPVLVNGLLGRCLRSAYLAYFDVESEAVFAATFDPGKTLVTGAAVPLTEQVAGNHGFDVADDGKLIYVPLPGAGQGEEIVWLDRKGTATSAMATRGRWVQPRVSPDGKRVVLRKTATDCELWMLDVERASLFRLAQSSDHHDPIWLPDGRRIVYQRADTRGEVFTLSVDGAREITRISQENGETPWSAAGNLLVTTRSGRGTQGDIWVRPLDGVSPGTAFLATEHNETSPAISPNGRWIAYASNESGALEVYVRPYPDTGRSWQISAGGGDLPVWSRDGREICFASGTKMMAAAVEAEPTFRVGAPVELFDGGFSIARTRDFDVAPDGRFIAVGRAGADDGRDELRMLLDWHEAMTRRTGPARRHS
jgi:Tol biopolymer transport system component